MELLDQTLLSQGAIGLLLLFIGVPLLRKIIVIIGNRLAKKTATTVDDEIVEAARDAWKTDK